MFERSLEGYSAEQRTLYQSLIHEGEELFKGKSSQVTIFHQVLLDRVADAYVNCLRVDSETFSEKKYKAAQDKLQRWLTMVFQEVDSVAQATKERHEFYKECVARLKKVVANEAILRDILMCLQAIVKEREK